MKKIFLCILICCPFYAMDKKQGVKRKHEETSAQQEITKNENEEIAQLQTSHQSLNDALLCITRPYNGQTDGEIAQTAKLLVSQPDIDVNTADLVGQTPLVRTALYKLPETMHVLLQAGARIVNLRNLQVTSLQQKDSVINTLARYKIEHEQQLADTRNILGDFLSVTHTHNSVAQLSLVSIILDYLRWPEDYSVTIPQTIQVTRQPQQMRQIEHSKGGGFGSRYY